MLNPRPDEPPNFGGSTRVKGEAVFRRFNIPTLFCVGERPAGAVNGVLEIVVFSLGAGERAGRIGLRGETIGLKALEESMGEGGAFVKKKLTGFWRVSTLDPSGDLSFLGERKRVGSRFSELSSSKDVALRLLGEERVEERAVGVIVRLEFMIHKGRCGMTIEHTILTILETREVLQA